MNKIEQSLCGSLCEILNVDIPHVSLLSMDLKNLNIDSLTFISFVVELEDVFGIEFDADKLTIDYFSTLQSIADYVKEKQGAVLDNH